VATQRRRQGQSSRLPHNVKKEHVETALQHIDEEGVPHRRRSTRYVIRYRGKEYPPKYAICRAYRVIQGVDFPNIFGGGPEANNFLIARGFEIYNKNTGERCDVQAEVEDEESTFAEGKQSYRLHRLRERDTKLARAAKNKRLGESGELRCDACGFSFKETYGDLGVGFIEAHHTIPVSEIRGRRKTRLEELALVCSNCHRMLHRTRPWLAVEELRTRIKVD